MDPLNFADAPALTHSAPPPGTTPPAAQGINPEWLDELKLDNFTVPRPSGGLMRPHIGQSLWLTPYGLSLEDSERVERYQAMSPDDPQEKIEAAFDAALFVLSKTVVTWNLKDGRGVPIPPPTGEGDKDAFRAMPARLLKYIIEMVRGEPEGNAGGASGA